MNARRAHRRRHFTGTGTTHILAEPLEPRVLLSTGTIHGIVFEDRNADGVRDEDDTPLVGTIIYADLNEDGQRQPEEPSASVGFTGSYSLTVPAGTRVLRAVFPAGFLGSYPPDGAHVVNVTPGMAIFNVNFGGYGTGGIAGIFFNDLNGNGTREGNEPTIAGRTAYVDLNRNGQLDDGEPTAISTTSYSFSLYPGTYHVRQLVPAEWQATAPPEGYYEVTVQSGYGAPGRNFGTFDAPPSVLSAAFDVDLPRQAIVLQFSEDIGALATGNIQLRRLENDTLIPGWAMIVDYSSDTYTARVSLSELFFSNGIFPDGTYRLTLRAGDVRDAAGNPMAEDFTFHFFSLAGDANRDGAVTIADLGILAANWQKTGMTFSQGDFNYDGSVTIADLGILAANWQKSLDLNLLESAEVAESASAVRALEHEAEPGPPARPITARGAGSPARVAPTAPLEPARGLISNHLPPGHGRWSLLDDDPQDQDHILTARGRWRAG